MYLMPYFNVPVLDCPELIIPAEDVVVMEKVFLDVSLILIINLIILST